MPDTEIYFPGDLVWAKMKGYPPWPGMISDPKGKRKNPYYAWIYFYGTNNYSWIHLKNIVPYMPRPLAKRKYTKKYMDACKKIDEIYYKRHPLKPKNTPSTSPISTPSTSTGQSSDTSTGQSSDTSTGQSLETSTGQSPETSTGQSPRTSTGQSPRTSTGQSPRTPTGQSPQTSTEVTKRSSTFEKSEGDRSTRIQLPDLLQNANASLGTGVYFTRPFRIGFIGLGSIGSRLAKNFIKAGYHVTVWNRTWEKTFKLFELGAQPVTAPADVVSMAEVIFSCVMDSAAAMNVMFGYYGVQERITRYKAYVELSTIDMDTSKLLSQAVIDRGGRYLEAQLEGSVEEAENGQLLVFAAGDRQLFNNCHTLLKVVSRGSFFLGQVGNGMKIKHVLHLMSGVFLAGYAEAMGLAQKIGLPTEDVLHIMGCTKMANQRLHENGKCITNFTTLGDQASHLIKKGLESCINMSHNVNFSVPMAAVAYERIKAIQGTATPISK